MNNNRTGNRRASETHQYSADRPIRSRKDDVLKRAKFAESLANDLRSWDGDDSLVVALYGAWGSGKTSVKNMVIEGVKGIRSPGIVVMEFNPWQLSLGGDIPASFFRELGIALGKEGSAGDVKKNGASRHHDDWLRKLRVCHPDMFEKYFTLTVADEDLSQSDLEGLLALTADAKKFVAACDVLKQRNLFKLAFERLDAYKEQIPSEAMPSLIQALCDMSDGFPEQKPRAFGRLFEFDLSALAWRLCFFGLKKEPDKNKRFQLLKEAIIRSNGLALPFEIADGERRVANREAKGHEFLVDEADVGVLLEICVQKLKAALKQPNFEQKSQCRGVLIRWSAWEPVEEVRGVIKDKIRTTGDALWLITIFLGERHSFGQEHSVRYSIALKLIERFIDVEYLAGLLEKLELETLNAREKIALREFQKARKRRAEGKSDNVDDMWDDPDEEILD